MDVVARRPVGRLLREPLPAPRARRRACTSHGEGALSLHLWGMLVAFVVAAVLTAYFVVRLSAAIERRDAEIAAMREQATRTERLAALTTLAAGAAHELGTPLGDHRGRRHGARACARTARGRGSRGRCATTPG